MLCVRRAASALTRVLTSRKVMELVLQHVAVSDTFIITNDPQSHCLPASEPEVYGQTELELDRVTEPLTALELDLLDNSLLEDDHVEWRDRISANVYIRSTDPGRSLGSL